MEKPSFSTRHGYQGQPKPITVRNDAPAKLRGAILVIARDAGFSPGQMRRVICNVLRELEDRNNWSEYPNIWSECEGHIMSCDWFKVYDICEAFSDFNRHGEQSNIFAEGMNKFFSEEGIGWKLVDGMLEMRGDEDFEKVLGDTQQVLQDKGKATAAAEFREALRDLSRRPEPDRTGAVQHAMAALECLARDICGEPGKTLGQILNDHKDQLAIPRPLDEVLSKVWGFASNAARHITEGREVDFAEAELVVHLSAVIVSYLSHKHGG